MRIHELAAGVTFTLGLAACNGQAGNNVGGAANLAQTNAVAAANETDAAGPCPFPNRNWRATITSEAEIHPAGGSTDRTPRIALTGEIGPDSSGHVAMMASGDPPPPTVFLDLLPSGLASGDDRGLTERTTYYDYQPGHVEAVIRCNGREVARVPIPAPAQR